MTDDELRKLDAAVAQAVMGWKLIEGYDAWQTADGQYIGPTGNFTPSEIIDSAFQVIDRMRDLGWDVRMTLCADGTDFVVVSKGNGQTVLVDMIAEPDEELSTIICKASIKAIRKLEEQSS